MLKDTQLMVKVLVGLSGIWFSLSQFFHYKVFRKVEEVLDELISGLPIKEEEKKIPEKRKLLLKKKIKE